MGYSLLGRECVTSYPEGVPGYGAELEMNGWLCGQSLLPKTIIFQLLGKSSPDELGMQPRTSDTPTPLHAVIALVLKIAASGYDGWKVEVMACDAPKSAVILFCLNVPLRVRNLSAEGSEARAPCFWPPTAVGCHRISRLVGGLNLNQSTGLSTPSDTPPPSVRKRVGCKASSALHYHLIDGYEQERLGVEWNPKGGVSNFMSALTWLGLREAGLMARVGPVDKDAAA